MVFFEGDWGLIKIQKYLFPFVPNQSYLFVAQPSMPQKRKSFNLSLEAYERYSNSIRVVSINQRSFLQIARFLCLLTYLSRQ